MWNIAKKNCRISLEKTTRMTIFAFEAPLFGILIISKQRKQLVCVENMIELKGQIGERKKVWGDLTGDTHSG